MKNKQTDENIELSLQNQQHFNFSRYASSSSEGVVGVDGSNDSYNNNCRNISPPNVSDSFSSDSSRLTSSYDNNNRLSSSPHHHHPASITNNRYNQTTTTPNNMIHSSQSLHVNANANISNLNIRRNTWNDNSDAINNKLFKGDMDNDRKQQHIYHHLHANNSASNAPSSSSLFENTTVSSSPRYQRQQHRGNDHHVLHHNHTSSFQQYNNSMNSVQQQQHRGGQFPSNYSESNNILRSNDDNYERRGSPPTTINSNRSSSYNNNFSSPHCANQQQQVFVMALPVQQSGQEHHPHHPPTQMFQPLQMVPVVPTPSHVTQQPALIVPNHHHHAMHAPTNIPFSSIDNVSYDDKISSSSSWTQHQHVPHPNQQQPMYQLQSYGVHPSSTQQLQTLHPHHHVLSSPSPFKNNNNTVNDIITSKKLDKKNKIINTASSSSSTFRNSPIHNINNHHNHELKQQEINESIAFINCNTKDDLSYRIIPETIDNALTDHHGLSSAAAATSSESIASLYHSAQRPHLSVLLGHVRRLSKDQVGCRLLQQSLDEDGPQAATAILREGLPFLAETMTDPFGNYLFQKILEKINPAERLQLISTVSPRLVNAALNLHGTRSVQKVVELSVIDNNNNNPAADIIKNALSPSAARLCIDSHGNHVMQRILQKFPPQYSKFIFDAVAHSVGDVARHRHGCCVIQRCLDSSVSLARSNLVKRIVDKALDLMQDAYGNYVVQYVLDVCNDEEASAVCESVVGRIALLAIQKFSSNVMEKCLERSNDWVQELYLRELSSPDKIRELMADPFGNYVVQRGLAVATHAQAIRLVETMRPHLQGMRNTAGGRRIIAKICRRFPDFDLNILNNNSLRFTSLLSLSEQQQQQQQQQKHQMHQVQYLSSPRQPLYCNHARQHNNNDIVIAGGSDSSTSSNIGMYVLNEFGG